MYDNGDLDRVVISPGPGHPSTDSGISRDVITWGIGKTPILGVCMGLECLVDVLGGEVSAPAGCSDESAASVPCTCEE
jgi:anthranilate synthase/indole-3-glycerol phosphate synthase/phosphoribosylanthranilate isomerase